MVAGRPPKPIELKELEGTNGRDLGGRKLPPPMMPKLARARLVPDIPEDVHLLSWGTRKWSEIWSFAWWLHDSDILLVAPICEDYDKVQIYQQKIDELGLTVLGYGGKGTVENPLIPQQRKLRIDIRDRLYALGFGPVARSKLQLNIAKTANALADFQSKVSGKAAPEEEDSAEGWDFEEEPEESDDIVDGEVAEDEEDRET